MKFVDVKTTCDEFRERLFVTTSRSYIERVSVEEPGGEEDELHFFKLVLWCYVFWYEASHPAGKHVGSLLRNVSPADYNKLMDVFRQVQYLRTVRAHNLDALSKDGGYKRNQATAWLLASGGEPTDWQKCCRTLCADVTVVVRSLLEIWTKVTSDGEDGATAIAHLNVFVDRELPAYRYDQIIEEAVARIGLQGLDVVAYRTTRLGRWQELFKFFSDRGDAEQALQRAILCELESLFGTPDRIQVAIASP